VSGSTDPDPDPARSTAYAVLLGVDQDGAYANLLLPRLQAERGLESRDAAFATELTYGALRWQGTLDVVIEAAARRPVERLDAPVRAVLRLGAYQLLHMNVPTHAAVHATVELTRRTAGHRVVGLVNAVLRKVSQNDWPGWVDRLAPSGDLARIALAAGYPAWIARALLDALGGDLDELARALAEDRPVTHLVARPGRISRDALVEMAGPEASPGPWSPYAVRLAGGDPRSIAAIRDGRAAVQDEGSQLVALALAQMKPDGPDRRWLDLCAGPGGKSALLAGLLPADAVLVASDLQPHRAGLVARALGGISSPGRAGVVVSDGRQPPWPPSVFDRVLVDAPCTGLGALRRRPEVRWRRQPEDVPRLTALQVDLLTTAVDSARPGGVVAYATCSPHPAETRAVVDAVRANRPDLDILDARPLFPGVPQLGSGPDVQLWPHRHGTDAMYVALLRTGLSEADSGP
jgi:16S rRNA (cytosine967-C5)-methyltransferase